jgi:hypothetical protein
LFHGVFLAASHLLAADGMVFQRQTSHPPTMKFRPKHDRTEGRISVWTIVTGSNPAGHLPEDTGAGAGPDAAHQGLQQALGKAKTLPSVRA